MKLIDLFEGDDDAKHAAQIDKTGFWGSVGAGCIILAKDTGKLLIAHRSDAVQEPNTWGSWGGAIDSKENPLEALVREINEETGYHGQIEVEPLYVFSKPGFKYYNYLAIVDNEFTPRLDWENQGFIWCGLDNLPKPLHFGLVALLKDEKSFKIIKEKISEYSRPAQQ
jgi:8-oxo-dGTP pyrophosphatase MutT (NUDIX family)